MAGKLILVVDDEKDIAEIVSDILRGEEFETTLAYDGQEALTAMRRLRPDAMVLDIKMPVLDGLQVIRHMQADPSLQGIPTVVLTATRVIEELEQEFRQYHVHSWISKPFEPEELIRCVTQALRSKENPGHA